MHPLMFVRIGQYLTKIYNYVKIWNLREQKNINIEKISFKVVQMKFFAMTIQNDLIKNLVLIYGQ